MKTRGEVRPVAARRRRQRIRCALRIVATVAQYTEIVLRVLAGFVFILVMLSQCVPHIDVSMLP